MAPTCDEVATMMGSIEGIPEQIHQDTMFHPPRLPAPKAVAAAAARLDTMPREIMHQILDDLPIFQVLQLASHRPYEDSRYLDDWILGVSEASYHDPFSTEPGVHIGHPQYKCLFESQEALTRVRDFFILFCALRVSTGNSFWNTWDNFHLVSWP